MVVKFLFTMFLFYTMINLLLVVFHKFTSKYIDLHLSCLVVAFVSFGITYIHPREVRYSIDETHKYVVKTSAITAIYDFILHWLPLIYVFITIPLSRSISKIARTFAFILIYLLATRAPDLYNFDTPISIIFCVLALVVRFAVSV